MAPSTDLVLATKALKPASKARIRELLGEYRSERAAGKDHHVPLDLLELHEALEYREATKAKNRGKPQHAVVVRNLATERKMLGTMGQSPVVTRAQWGARSPKSPYSRINAAASVTYHYEGPQMGTFDHSTCASKVRGIQNFHMDTRGWADIAYSHIVCPHGYVFVCRGNWNKTAANGTTTGNATSYAICFLGGAGDPFVDLSKKGFLDARLHLRFEGGATEATKSHSEWHSTSCPGDPIRAWENAGSPAPAGYNSNDPTPPPAPTPITPPAPTMGRVGDAVDFMDDPASDGGWMLDKSGGIYTLAPSGFYGSLGGVALNAPIVGGIVTPTGRGYTLFGADGGIFTFGDAPFRGTYAALADEYRAGTRSIIGGFFRGNPADVTTWSYTLVSDRLEAYAIA